MGSRDSISGFAEQYSFKAGTLPDEELDGIQCAVDCHKAINDGYMALPAFVLEKDLAIGLLWQLYERSTERVFGALVAMATSCVASSEILARASIEATVSIRYILRDPTPRLVAFFRDHVERAERQESSWRQAASQLGEPDRTTHLASCDYRRQGVGAMKSVVDAMNAGAPTGAVAAWPNISARFKAVGEDMSYRTLYSRLCAEPHLDAEETLRYFIGKTGAPELFRRMAIETVMFSRFVLAEAVRGYAEAGKEFANIYDMASSFNICTAAERTMEGHALRLSEHIGAKPAGRPKHQGAG